MKCWRPLFYEGLGFYHSCFLILITEVLQGLQRNELLCQPKDRLVALSLILVDSAFPSYNV